MHEHLQFIQSLIERGGPRPADYAELDAWVSRFYEALDAGELPAHALSHARQTFGDILTPRTMHGHAYSKPHGYAGDFEIIDRHYLHYVAPEPHLAAWDHYWQAGTAAKAVRNRKRYFHSLLSRHSEAASNRRLSVLNVASGPGRDVFEFLSSGPRDVHFECIDQDSKALAHAARLCSGFSHQVTFAQTDVLRFRPRARYDLIWAAGLFDYFSDRVFKLLLRRLLPGVAPGGELVIGNFSIENPNSDWMRFCDWLLHHRNRNLLTSLALNAGASPEHITIGSEPEGVNLFLHIASPE